MIALVRERKLPAATLSYLEELFSLAIEGLQIFECRLDSRCPYDALTYGNTIIIREGYFAPECTWGLKILAHELTHVFQQRAGLLKERAERKSLLYVPELEEEAERYSAFATISPAGRPDFASTFAASLTTNASPPSLAFQPVIKISDAVKEFEPLWADVQKHFFFKRAYPRWDKTQKKVVKKKLTDEEKEAAKAKLQYWCTAPESASLSLATLQGKSKGVGKYYTSILECVRDVVWTVLIDLGGARATEAELARLIEVNNKKVAKLLTEAVRRIHTTFHQEMLANDAFSKKFSSHHRKYAWYYSTLYQKVTYVISQVTKKKETLPEGAPPLKKFDSNQLRTVEQAFKYFLKKGANIPSWQLVAFLSDYAGVAKYVFPAYFSTINPDWWKPEARRFSTVVIESQRTKLRGEFMSVAQTKEYKDEYTRYYDEAFDEQQYFEFKFEDFIKQKIEEKMKEYGEDLKKDAKMFGTMAEGYEQMFSRLPQIGARSKKGGISQYNVGHSWSKKAHERLVPLGNGPSGTTTFLLTLLQVVYPHEETILAAALAMFEFWQRHYKQMQGGIHTWHEVMVAASPYMYNFNFVSWKKEDAPRDLSDHTKYDFGYPEPQVLVGWLTSPEKKVKIPVQPTGKAKGPTSKPKKKKGLFSFFRRKK